MMNRNEFLKSSVGLAAALIGIGATSACGSDGGSGPPDAKGNSPDASPSGGDGGVDGTVAVDGNPGVVSCSMNGTNVAIGTNHGHNLVVSKADIAAGVDKMYSIQGISPHDHIVTVTAAQFAMLAANTSITVESSPTIHTHTVTISCVAA